ncbi:hypothetical protein EW145_g5280 [Phellinidium pouzarii]|uniref:ABC transmembrane type-1 domain-containing protein n=1 Tax=Phellinidium pouzarii TaxID=167371 RepID=A0A4S4L134_9AGAM|nr:hypothetical protein EW145_g5280 [Phellinidium pouzarii]
MRYWSLDFAAMGSGDCSAVAHLKALKHVAEGGSLAEEVISSVRTAHAFVVEQAAERFRHAASLDATYLVYIGVGMFVATFVYMYAWVYTGEVSAKRVRERYLKAVLRQDVAYFDNVGAGEVASRIQTDTHLIQQGISEKVALSVSFIAAFVTGFIVAYVRSWRLALALSSILPCIGITGVVMNQIVSKYMQTSLKHVAEGGSLAEEVISSVRTAHAFGTQHVLSDLYDSHIEKSQFADLNAALVNGIGFAVFFFHHVFRIRSCFLLWNDARYP